MMPKRMKPIQASLSNMAVLVEKIDALYRGADGANAGPHGVGRPDRQRLKSESEESKTRRHARTVPIVGKRRVKPSVYLRPIVQPISHRPATMRKSQAMQRP